MSLLACSSTLRALLALAPLALTACEPPLSAANGDLSRLEPQPLTELQEGLITWYNAEGIGNCGFDPSPPEDPYFVALTKVGGLYGNATWCGGCVEVQGPLGSVVARVVDSCPDCGPNHLDMSPQAFEKVARLVDGRVQIKWRFVSCPVQGPLRYRVKEGSSEWWTALQVRNHRVPLKRLEWFKQGSWVEAPRQDFNYFIEPKGMGPGELRLRVISWDNQFLEDTLPGAQPERIFEGQGQFRPR
jgi:expansin